MHGYNFRSKLLGESEADPLAPPPVTPVEPHEHYTLDIDTLTPQLPQSKATLRPNSQRQLNFEARAWEKQNPNQRIAIRGQYDAKRVVRGDNASDTTRATGTDTHDDPHTGPGGAVGRNKKFTAYDKGLASVPTKQPHDDQGILQGSGSEHVNHTKQKDEGSKVPKCPIKSSEEAKGASELANPSARVDATDDSFGLSDGSNSKATEAIDDGMNGELVFPVMQLCEGEGEMFLLSLCSCSGGFENSELVVGGNQR